MSNAEDMQLLQQAEKGIEKYLASERDAGRITGTYFDDAVKKTMPNLTKWLLAEELDVVSPNLREGLRIAIREERWVELTNAYSRNVSFGTGGIREKMGPTRDVIFELKEKGIHAPIIKGPNTINDVVYLMTAAGVAKFGQQRDPKLTKVVVGFDSRVRGIDFARAIASLFLAYDYTVFLFDEACLYPSVTFAVPTLKADAGVFISASHNDLRYNGFKLSCQNGSQFDPEERKRLYEDFITQVNFSDIKLQPLSEASPGKLWFLGGQKSGTARQVDDSEMKGYLLADPLSDASADLYAGFAGNIIDLHTMHINHVKQFLKQPTMIAGAKNPISIGFSAFNGSGRKAVPRLLNEIGFKDVKRIMALDPLDGTFPAFENEPGKEQQPDPGDYRAADVAVKLFKEEYGEAWDSLDLLIGTDPDADRLGVIIKVPENQKPAYKHPVTKQSLDYSLMSADEAWSLILWYRLTQEQDSSGKVRDADKKFIVLSHTTTDLLTRVARKFGLGVMKTWVGFAQLAAGTRAAWDLSHGKDTPGLTESGKLPAYDEGRTALKAEQSNRSIHSIEAMDGRNFNVAALEQSNGFSMLGGPPKDDRSLGEGGHVRDKDGAFAAVLMAELAQYAKEEGMSLLDLIDEKLYLDADVGLYITHYEPDPIDGEYEGLAGYTKKRVILDKAEDLFKNYAKKGATLGGLPIVSTTSYRTGKYDAINFPGFPDEGYRFYFDDERRSHLTIRPSGTSNALRFHVQLFGGFPTRNELVLHKAKLRETCAKIVEDVRELIGAQA